jgi:hypothetical protein
VRIIKTADRLHNLSELHLAPDAARARRCIAGTLKLATALANGAPPRIGRALVAALQDGIRAASRAQGLARHPTTPSHPLL